VPGGLANAHEPKPPLYLPPARTCNACLTKNHGIPLSVILAFPYAPHGAPKPSELGHLNSPVLTS